MSSTAPLPAALSLDEQVAQFEVQLIRQTLALTRGDVRAAAKSLQMSERTFWRRLRQRGIEPADFRLPPKPKAVPKAS